MNFLGAKNVSFKTNGLLTFRVFYWALKREREKNNQNNKSNKTCSFTISLLQVKYLLMSFSKMTPLKA